MKDLITILVIGVIIVLRIRSGLKKTIEETSQTPEAPTDWEGEELYMGEEELIEEPEKRSRFEQILAIMGKSQESRQAPAPKLVESNPAEIVQSVTTPTSTPERRQSLRHELRSVQGARKAFIYSEIFKRKYE